MIKEQDCFLKYPAFNTYAKCEYGMPNNCIGKTKYEKSLNCKKSLI